MRLITEIELNKVSGGIWDNTDVTNDGSTYIDGVYIKDFYEVNLANGESGISANMNGQDVYFVMNELTGVATMRMGRDTFEISPMTDDYTFLQMKINGEHFMIIPNPDKIFAHPDNY